MRFSQNAVAVIPVVAPCLPACRNGGACPRLPTESPLDDHHESSPIDAGEQRADLLPIFIDLPLGFDALAAQRAGVQLDRLLLVRPASVQDALSLVYDLLREGNCGLIVLDSGDGALPDPALRLLSNAVVRSSLALVCLTAPERSIPGADLRPSMTRIGWEMAGGDCYAVRTRVTVESGSLPVGRSAGLRFVINEMAPCWPAS